MTTPFSRKKTDEMFDFAAISERSKITNTNLVLGVVKLRIQNQG